MNDDIINGLSRRDKFNKALQGLISVMREPQDKCVDLLIRSGVRGEDIAVALGISARRFYQLYPASKRGGEKHD